MTLVLGDVRFANDQLDDMVLLRSDGTPTYMLAVVVDDHDMGVTHVIRGADHLNNAARQLQIIEAMGWPVPVYGHLPLINGPDGAKLSKRHGALAVEAYRDMGYLPETMRNYLLRLGWSHGDDEIISTAAGDRMVQFRVHRQKRGADGLQEARQSERPLYPRDRRCGAGGGSRRLPGARNPAAHPVRSRRAQRLQAAMPSLKERAKTLVELDSGGGISVHGRCPRPGRGRRQAADAGGPRHPGRAPCPRWKPPTGAAPPWKPPPAISPKPSGLKLGQVAQPLRAALTGKATSPPLFEMLALLGREESLIRLRAYAA